MLLYSTNVALTCEEMYLNCADKLLLDGETSH